MSYVDFFLKSKSSVKKYETLSISHPNFSKTYDIVRNAAKGITATKSGVSTAFEYRPVQIKGLSVNDTLDQVLTVQLGDLGKIVPLELDNIADADGFATKPALEYRVYRSDDLTAELYGPITLEVPTFNSVRSGSGITASAPRVNNNRTGEFYVIARFPMLRGFL